VGFHKRGFKRGKGESSMRPDFNWVSPALVAPSAGTSEVKKNSKRTGLGEVRTGIEFRNAPGKTQESGSEPACAKKHCKKGGERSRENKVEQIRSGLLIGSFFHGSAGA